MAVSAGEFPVRLQSAGGVSVQVNANGSIRRIDLGDVTVNLFLGSEIEGGPANIWLRRRGAAIEAVPLLGPRSPSTIHLDAQGFAVRGEWNGVRFAASLSLAADAAAWFWHVTLENAGATPATLDLVYAQDLALAPYGAVRMNEYYVSQYVDYTPLAHAARGTVLAVRQNLAMGGRHPWAVVGSLGRGASCTTDALALHGLATRAGGMPAGLVQASLPGRRQHEHSMAVIQDEPVELAPGAVVARGFFVRVEGDHPDASSPADLAFVDRTLALPEAAPRPAPFANGTAPAATLFTASRALEVDDLDENELERLFGGERRALETDGAAVLSFFTDDQRHVVTRAKDLGVLRPHGQVLRTGDGLVPDEGSLTTTSWMHGVFHSLVTQGHCGINRFLSTVRSYLGLFRAQGQRVFVEVDGAWRLLDEPSAFEMTPGGCRWLYRHAGGLIAVAAWAATDRHELGLTVDVVDGEPMRLLVTSHLALGGDDGAEPKPARITRDGAGIVVHAVPDTDVGWRFPDGWFRIDPEDGTAIERVGGDELLFADGRSRDQPYVVIGTGAARRAAFRITGGLVPSPRATGPVSRPAAAEARRWTDLSGDVTIHPPGASSLAHGLPALQDILPWIARDAMVHYLAPRGLEQFSGGGWGTRDVCQGPVELLLAIGRWAPIRDLLLRVFGQQNPDGDWPQWFTFFARDRGIRADDSHGDIVFWPLLALAHYVLASDDLTILDAVVPFWNADAAHAETATLAAHVERALEVVARRTIPGTALVAYGHGDWNDSLQPVDPKMRERLCSAWTVTLHVQTLTALASAYRLANRAERAGGFAADVVRINADFQRRLFADGVLAGFAYFHDDGRVDYLLHPRDCTTGVGASLLPMIHAIINDMLTPDEARAHIGLIREQILGVDGARLFDRPPPYRGGPEHVFQRAESSTFFGREIGLMYVHAHLRWAEALAHFGDADAFFAALRQANPIGMRDVVPCAARRQLNCYYSSSDAAVADRYEAAARYQDVRSGAFALEGGWRVYSSGAGIAVRLFHQCFLGIRRGRTRLTFDPVMPKALDGLAVDLMLDGRPVRVVYRVGAVGAGPVSVEVNGSVLRFEREANAYRPGAVSVPTAAVVERLKPRDNELVVTIG